MNNALFHTTCAALLAVTVGSISTKPADPDGWIPMWVNDDDKDNQSCLINTSNIVTITPVYDAENFSSRNPKINYLEVVLTDGRRLTIYEDYEEFKKRIRNAR